MQKQYNLWTQLGLIIAAGVCLLTGWYYNSQFTYLIERLEYGSNSLLMGSISVFLGAFGAFLIFRLLCPSAEQRSNLVGGWLLLVFAFLAVILKLLMGGMGEQMVSLPFRALGRNLTEWILYAPTPALLFGVAFGWLFGGQKK